MNVALHMEMYSLSSQTDTVKRLVLSMSSRVDAAISVFLLQSKLDGPSSWKIFTHSVSDDLHGDEWVFTGTPFSCDNRGPDCNNQCWPSRLQSITNGKRVNSIMKKYGKALSWIKVKRNEPVLYLPSSYKTRGAICFGRVVKA